MDALIIFHNGQQKPHNIEEYDECALDPRTQDN